MQTLLAQPFKAVLFDMDNTLFDFVEAMKRACTAVVADLGFGSADELLSYYLRWKYHFEDNTNLQDFMIAHNQFTVEGYFHAVEVLEKAKLDNLKLYEGIDDVLAALCDAGYGVGVVTDAFSFAAEKRLGKCGLKPYVSSLIAYDTTGYKKPHTAPFEEALAAFNVMPYEAVFVGDSLRRDVLPAFDLGITPIYAKYGDRNFFDSPLMTPPQKTLVAEKPSDILRILL